MDDDEITPHPGESQGSGRPQPIEVRRYLRCVDSCFSHWASIEQLVESRTMAEPIYKVIFSNQGEIYEIYARGVSQGGLFGFVEIEELSFGDSTKVVIDPAQERLEREFLGVKRTHVPLHAIVRIDEVDEQGIGRITSPKEGSDGNVRVFPTILPSGDGPPAKK